MQNAIVLVLVKENSLMNELYKIFIKPGGDIRNGLLKFIPYI